MAVDTHCHPFLMEEEPGAIAARARKSGVGRLVSVGIDPESSQSFLYQSGCIVREGGSHARDFDGV